MQADTVQAIAWCDDHIRILDQTLLPAQEVYIESRDLETVADAIRRLAVRGAPAIGIAAAMGLAFEARKVQAATREEFIAALMPVYELLRSTRPTAVNLQWALDRMMAKAHAAGAASVDVLKGLLVAEARAIHAEDIENNRAMGRFGQEVVPQTATIMTICNTGALCCGGHGTALGVIRTAAAMGKKITVVACETRPLLQGARLTAWELTTYGIPFKLITDGMAAFYMKKKGIDLVITGADRVAANGDSANKIGTYSLAVLAGQHGVPFYIAAPRSTVDMAIANGDAIPIEERAADEVTGFGGCRTAPVGTPVWNPSFDVTPAGLIAGIITDRGLVRPPYETNLKTIFTH
ncbi:MAG: S-methyl-5-thioribose-1-phosphate isomerase [Proteobacteria bacterium]|nr:S-methyl-5-thioribose-1-phosphate isomerase [Pseudomonadota bacterium]